MEKIFRDSLDVAIVFNSSARRIAADSEADNLNKTSHFLISSPAHHSVGSGAKSYLSLRSTLRKPLRSVARIMYRVLKPLIRPFALRIRRFLIEGLQQNIQQVSASLHQEMQMTMEKLTHNNLRASVLLQELQDSSVALQRELKNQKTCLERIEQYSFATVRRNAVNCGDGELLIRSEVGYVLCPASDKALIACLLDGELERGTRLLIQHFLKPGDTFVDIGANIGLHTLAAARTMRGQGRIFAFEPFEPVQRLLTKTMWLNGFSEMTEIHQAGVFNSAGQRELFLGPTCGHHSLLKLTGPENVCSASVIVPLVRLDEVIPDSTVVSLIKIDAEGAELEILESARSIIKNNHDIALIVEFGFSHLIRAGHSTQEWLSEFASLGLIYQAINVDTGRLEKWSPDQLEQVNSINLFFAHADSRVWTRMESL